MGDVMKNRSALMICVVFVSAAAALPNSELVVPESKSQEAFEGQLVVEAAFAAYQKATASLTDEQMHALEAKIHSAKTESKIHSTKTESKIHSAKTESSNGVLAESSTEYLDYSSLVPDPYKSDHENKRRQIPGYNYKCAKIVTRPAAWACAAIACKEASDCPRSGECIEGSAALTSKPAG